MLGSGAIGFGLGATPNALVNMLSLASKHGPSPRAWLVVSLVGAFLIDFANAFLITQWLAFFTKKRTIRVLFFMKRAY